MVTLRDHWTSVLIAFAVNALATLAVLLILAALPTRPPTADRDACTG